MTVVGWRVVIIGMLLAVLALPGGASAAAPTLTLVAPADGATVSGDSATIQVQVSGVTLRPADGLVDPSFGHLHYFLDRQPDLTPGAVVPVGPANIVHSPETSVTFRNLAPGRHTVWVVLGLGSHQLTSPVVAVSTTFTVAVPAQPTAAPAPAATRAPVAAGPAATATAAPARPAAAATTSAAGQPATAARPAATALPRTGAGGPGDGAVPAWWTLYSGLVVLLVAFGLRGLARRR